MGRGRAKKKKIKIKRRKEDRGQIEKSVRNEEKRAKKKWR